MLVLQPTGGNVLTKWQVANLLFAEQEDTIVEMMGDRWWVTSIQRESGNGKSFLFTVKRIHDRSWCEVWVTTSD